MRVGETKPLVLAHEIEEGVKPMSWWLVKPIDKRPMAGGQVKLMTGVERKPIVDVQQFVI